jgi:isopentenyl-diphosphate Delta-isomerase
MGFSIELKPLFQFTYKAEFSNGLTEHEFDHVFSGIYNGEVVPDKREVQDHCYKSIAEIDRDIAAHPEKYTAWFKIAFPKVNAIVNNQE